MMACRAAINQAELRLARLVAQGGGVWVGLQHGTRGEDYILFNDPISETTLSLVMGQVTAEAVAAKIQESRRPAMNHTPGPWTVDPDPRHLPGGVVLVGSIIIARVNSSNNTEATRVANARLIAAAPKMKAFIEKWLVSVELTGMKNDASEEARALLRELEEPS